MTTLHFWQEPHGLGETVMHKIENYDGPIPDVGDNVLVTKDGENEVVNFDVRSRQFEFHPDVFIRGYRTEVVLRNV